MAKPNTKIGDVFSAKIDEVSRKYLQYVVSDMTQLNSDVVRIFKRIYPLDVTPALSEIVSGEIDFYAHCVTKLGLQLGHWEKVGNVDDIGKIEILFRSSGDVGNPQIKVSRDWWVWRVNEEQRWVGVLDGENRTAEIGRVISPDSIVHRMRTGEYDFVYPGYE